jgi:hypothetical protein
MLQPQACTLPGEEQLQSNDWHNNKLLILCYREDVFEFFLPCKALIDTAKKITGVGAGVGAGVITWIIRHETKEVSAKTCLVPM